MKSYSKFFSVLIVLMLLFSQINIGAATTEVYTPDDAILKWATNDLGKDIGEEFK